MKAGKLTLFLWIALGIFYVAKVIYKYTKTNEIDYIFIVLACIFLFVGIYSFLKKPVE